MAQSDQIFKAILFMRPRGRSYPEHWRHIERRCIGERHFAKDVEAAIKTFVPKAWR